MTRSDPPAAGPLGLATHAADRIDRTDTHRTAGETTMTAKYITPPTCQGQTVSVSYCQAGDILIRRCRDRSDRSDTYAMVTLDDYEISAIDPANTEPTPAGEWTEINEAMADRLAGQG